MKITKNTKAIAVDAKLSSTKQSEKFFIGWQITKEIAPVVFVSLIMSFYLKCCLAMEEPIYLQKALICSFIIMALLCIKKSNQLR